LDFDSSRLIGFHRFSVLVKLAKKNLYKKSTEGRSKIHRCFKIRIFRPKTVTLFKPLSQRWVLYYYLTSSPDLPLSWPHGKSILFRLYKYKHFLFYREFRKLQEQITVTRQMVSLIGFIGWIGLSGLFGLFRLFGSLGYDIHL